MTCRGRKRIRGKLLENSQPTHLSDFTIGYASGLLEARSMVRVVQNGKTYKSPRVEFYLTTPESARNLKDMLSMGLVNPALFKYGVTINRMHDIYTLLKLAYPLIHAKRDHVENILSFLEVDTPQDSLVSDQAAFGFALGAIEACSLFRWDGQLIMCNTNIEVLRSIQRFIGKNNKIDTNGVKFFDYPIDRDEAVPILTQGLDYLFEKRQYAEEYIRRGK